MPAAATFFVTGAAGFIGSRLVQALIEAATAFAPWSTAPGRRPRPALSGRKMTLSRAIGWN